MNTDNDNGGGEKETTEGASVTFISLILKSSSTFLLRPPTLNHKCCAGWVHAAHMRQPGQITPEAL